MGEPKNEPKFDKGKIPELKSKYKAVLEYATELPEQKKVEQEAKLAAKEKTFDGKAEKLWKRTRRHYIAVMNKALDRKIHDVERELSSVTDPDVIARRTERLEQDINEKADDLWEISKATVESMVDSKTGLLTEGAFQKQYDLAMDSLNRESTPDDHCAIVISFDLDLFRQVNDVFGHEGADEILGIIGERMDEVIKKNLRNLPGDNNALRTSDSACHISGDEFVLLLNHVPKEHINAAIERFHSLLSIDINTLPSGLQVKAQNKDFKKISASFGCLIVNKKSDSLDPPLYFVGDNGARAVSDQLSRVSKSRGRNAYTVGRYAEGGLYSDEEVESITCYRLEGGQYNNVYDESKFPEASIEDARFELNTAIQRITDQIESAIRKGTLDKEELEAFKQDAERMARTYHRAKKGSDIMESLRTFSMSMEDYTDRETIETDEYDSYDDSTI